MNLVEKEAFTMNFRKFSCSTVKYHNLVIIRPRKPQHNTMHGRASLPSATIRNQYASAEAFPVFSSRPGILFRLQRGGNNLRQKKIMQPFPENQCPFDRE